MFRWLWRKTKWLWNAARSERASPREIAWAVGLGVFAGCTPAIGFHGGLAVAIATAARKNRLFAFVGSRISNFLILPFIIVAEVQVAHRVRAGTWVTIDRDLDHAKEQAAALFLDWCLGTIPVGAGLGVLFGLLAWRLALWRDRRRAAAARIAP